MLNETEIEATLESLNYLADQVPTYGGRLEDFAASMDSLDTLGPRCMRDRVVDIAKLVAHETDDVVAWHHVAISWACQGDAWAVREVAGRFMSAVRRLRLAWKVRAHSGCKFWDLAEAIVRARYTAKQWAFAKKLAAEVDAREERAAELEAAAFLAAHASDYANLCDAE